MRTPITILLLLTLASCGSMKKSRTESSFLLDTTSVSTVKEVEVKKDNSTNTVASVTELSGDKIKLKITYSDAEPGKQIFKRSKYREALITKTK